MSIGAGRADGCIGLRPRRWRRLWCPHLHRAGRGAGCTAGDVLEVRILDIVPRPSRNPDFEGQVFGSSVAAWWGYHYNELLAEPKLREAVTIYEIFAGGEGDHGDSYARALYSYRWEPQTDPFGVVHQTYDYPGVPIAPDTVKRRHNVLDGIRIPLRPHFGVIAVAPREVGLRRFDSAVLFWRQSRQLAARQGIDGIPAGVGAGRAVIGRRSPRDARRRRVGRHRDRMFDDGNVSVDPAQEGRSGRPRVCGFDLPPDRDRTDWVLTGFSHPNYLAEFGAKGQSEVYATSSLDLAMKDAFRKMRRFLMNIKASARTKRSR